MQFKTVLFGALALASSVVAQSTTLFFTSIPDDITAGQTYTIRYSANDTTSPVTITLRKGDPNNLETISTLTSDSTGGSYQWSVDSNLVAADDYALQITQSDQINYSGLFSIFSTVLPTSSSGTSSTSSTASSSGSSSTASASASASSTGTITAAASLSSSLAAAASSLSSVIASANSSLAAISSANATLTSSLASVTPSSNATLHTSTVTRTATSTTGTGAAGSGSSTASASGTAPSSGAIVNTASPMALIFCAVAAMAYLN